jgi:acyl carrier protein
MSQATIEDRIETYVQKQFNVSASDPGFDRSADLFERGYVDSVGFVEMLEFLRAEFGVEVPEEDLMSDEFTSIEGISGVVRRLGAG